MNKSLLEQTLLQMNQAGGVLTESIDDIVEEIMSTGDFDELTAKKLAELYDKINTQEEKKGGKFKNLRTVLRIIKEA